MYSRDFFSTTLTKPKFNPDVAPTAHELPLPETMLMNDSYRHYYRLKCKQRPSQEHMYLEVIYLPPIISLTCPLFVSFFNLTYSRWTSSLPSCLWSLRVFPSLPGSHLTIFYRDASSALFQLVNQWLNFTYSRSHAFRYERKNTNPTLVRIELTTFALAGVQVSYY